VSAAETIVASSALRLLGGLRADGRAVSLAEHDEQYGALPLGLGADELLRRVAASGLAGRGGAAFPTAVKLDSVRDRRRRPVVVANGAEGEPPSGKDKVLLGYVPHLVLDGAVIAARIAGAKQVVVAVASASHASLARALAERRREKIDIGTVVVPDRFVAGEETALVQFLNGGPALPTFTPPRPYERGVGGAPTVILNVETLAHIALIARFGADWFRAVGTFDEPGSALVTLSGAVRRPGVYEIELGTPLAHLLEQAGPVGNAQAYLVGGYFGTWLSASDARRAVLSNRGLAPFGAALGARAIVALPHDACGLVETARVARYLAEQGARQCGPCLNGLPAIANALEELVRGEGDAPDLGLLRRRLALVAGRGACSHPDGAVAFIASALDVFAPEVERHLAGHRCTGHSRPILPIP
jgi:NADH:ubiquinone oxidoreductase subunit F (NADH-binding)